MSDLIHIQPSEALEMYLEDVSGELSPNSVRQKRYQLSKFVHWCSGADAQNPRIENLNNIDGRDFTRFKNWRSTGISQVTLRTNLSALRTFMRFCVSIDAVDPTIPKKVDIPDLDHGEKVRDSMIEADRADEILAYLDEFEYASLDHVLFVLMWRCGVRMSALRSLDVDDVEIDEQRLEIRHRPEDPEEEPNARPITIPEDATPETHDRKIGTRLKNGYKGERTVALSPETTQVLADYIEHKHTHVVDEYGRVPLFSSARGRQSKGNLSKHVYYLTSPCWYGAACPGGRDPKQCEHTGTFSSYVECPHNVRPHDVRRGSITYWLRKEVPERVVSDRMDVSSSTLDRHYDQRTEAEQTEQRREFLDDADI